MEKVEPAGMMKKTSQQKSQRLWTKLVMRKWLNIGSRDPEYGANTQNESENDDSSSDEDGGESIKRGREDEISAATEFTSNDAPMKLRRRNSETLRAQYINTKEIRVCVGTWNVGGALPPSDLDIDEWIDINHPADIYVLGLQEIVPLNAGNILGAEDNRPVAKWEEVIGEALNRVRRKLSTVKSYSDPPSPGSFKPCEETNDVVEEEVAYESNNAGVDEEEANESLGELKHDGGVMGEVNTLIDPNFGSPVVETKRLFSSPKKLERQLCLRGDSFERKNNEDSSHNGMQKLNRMLSGKERIGLSWPEPPLNMLGPSCVLGRQPSLKTVKPLKTAKSFKGYSSFKSLAGSNDGISPEVLALAEVDLTLLMKKKRRPAYVRVVSKQMVGILLTIWVKRGLRKHIQHVRVSTVGVGVGRIGNKGAVSVSLSIHQTFFCFVCSHLTAGERVVDQIKRNADVHEIHKRTIFHSVSPLGLPKHIYDHDRIIWLGDLNYRINLSYEKTRDLISKKEWSKLLEHDQLVKEYKKGRAFDGWSEGTIQFAPTYKYKPHSSEYTGNDGKGVRRTPAWCDRVLSYGKGLRLIHYRRIEQNFSDHRPVTAVYMAEVEVFSARKLQRALTFTDAEVEDEQLVAIV